MSGGTYQFQETSQQPGHGSLGHQLRFRTWSMSCELPDVQWLSAKTEARAGAAQEEDGEAVGASSGGGMSTVGRRRIILAQDGRVPGASRIPGFLNGGQEGSTPSTLKNQKTQETNTRRTAARSSGSVAVWQALLSMGWQPFDWSILWSWRPDGCGESRCSCSGLRREGTRKCCSVANVVEGLREKDVWWHRWARH